jgi:hypothetical protein
VATYIQVVTRCLNTSQTLPYFRTASGLQPVEWVGYGLKREKQWLDFRQWLENFSSPKRVGRFGANLTPPLPTFYSVGNREISLGLK